MKKNSKPLVVISIILLILSLAASIYSHSIFWSGVKSFIEENPLATGVNFVFFIIFDAGTMIISGINIIPNLIHIIKVRTKFSVIMFIISILLFVMAAAMFAIYEFVLLPPPSEILFLM